MKEFQYIALREKPDLMNEAAVWFHSKWGVPRRPILNAWKPI